MSPEALRVFRAWFAARDAGEWDRQVEDDAVADKLDVFDDEALKDLREERCPDL